MSKQIILIGGAPTTGKSTLAKALSNHFDIPWISSDQIREIMKATVDPEKYPSLFTQEIDADTFYNNFTMEQIVEMEKQQAKEIWPGVKAFIKNNFVWRKGFIVEGVGLLPYLIDQDFKNNLKIKPLFLVDNNREKIRDICFNRGLWGAPADYPDSIKEKEVEWVLLFDKEIREETTKYNYPVIEVGKNDEDIKKALEILNNNIN